jgi:PAS domain S-box-containing protein
LSSPRILIVDDHEGVRKGIRSLFATRPEWTICGEAADGVEAIEKAKSLQPDVILMDVSMPRMDGVEATRIIRRETPEINVLIISQNDPGLMQEAAVHVGAKAFIQKSKLAQDLFPALKKVVGSNGKNGSERNLSGSEVVAPSAASSPSAEQGDAVSPSWLAGGGEMGQRMRSLDWSQTALGPTERWPQSLKTSISICLASRFPIVMYWGPEFVVLYNDAYSTILGSKHPWALGQTCRDCWAEIWDTIGPMLQSVVDSAQATWSGDLLLSLKRHGYPEECYFSFSFSPIRIETGAVGGVFTAVMETTDKVIGERRSKTLRDLAARAVDANDEEDAWRIAAMTLGQNLHDVPFSVLCQVGRDTGVRILGTSGIEPSHELCTALCTSGSGLYEHLQRAANSREKLEIKDLRDWKGGELPRGAWQVAPESAIVLPLGDAADGRAPSVLFAAVSPQKALSDSYRSFFQLVAQQIAVAVADARSYDEERKRAEALAELDRAKTAFFSNVSHEFRTPLTLLLGPLEDTLAEHGLGTEQRERLELAHRNSLRLLKLVNALLDFSRIEANRIRGSYEPTDLAAFTAELVSAFHSAVERARMRLVIDCPALSEPVYVDREMWEKIVLNLLSNAFKYTFEGEIKVSLRQSGNAVQLLVKDTGTGIPAHHLPHLFERFYRVEGAKGRTNEGSGIGLALVQELVKLHGGTVEVESKVGHGSTFTVTIPLGKAHLLADRIGAKPSQASTETSREAFVQEALHWLPRDEDLQDEIRIETSDLDKAAASQPQSAARPRILLADDNADMREYVGKLLRDHYDVEAVTDGEKALQCARRRRPDLILSDVMMPGLDGFGLLQAVRSDEVLKSVPVILLSARAGEESMVEGLQSGADDYLIKPFSARELQARVKSHLAMVRMRQEGQALEHKLRLDAELLAAIVASSDDAIVSKDLNGFITSWNKSAERIFGYTAQEAVGQHITFIIPPERRHEEEGILERLRRGERIDHFQTVRMRKDGTLVDVSLTISPVRDSAGKVIGASKVARDVTQQKHAEERERHVTAQAVAATAKFRAVFEQTTVFAGVMTNDGILVEANNLFLEGCGYRAEDTLGKPFWETGWWRNYPDAREKIRAATPLAAQGICYRDLLPYCWADGTERLVDFALYPILNDEGEVLFLHPSGVDITDHKRAEERYRKLAENLEVQVRARTVELENRNADVLRQSDLIRKFSQGLLQAQDEERRRIARELHDSAGQTLTVLSIGLAQLAQKAARTAPELATDAEVIEETVRQLHREIRTTSYLLHPPLLDEAGLSSALSWYVQGVAERSGLEISLDVSQQVGRLPREMELVVFRLVQECLTNVHRHSGSKSASICIDRAGQRLIIDIRDQGKGISPERLAAIQSHGSGVGIRGMRERLRQFEGDLQIESDNSGTRILVTIPLSADASQDEEPGTEPLQAAV